MIDQYKLKKRGADALSYMVLLLWSLFCLTPILLLFAGSLNDTSLTRTPDNLLLFRSFTFSNYERAFMRGDFLHHFKNSLIISFAALTVSMAVCCPLAYGLTKMKKKIRDKIAFIILSIRFVPYIVLALPFILIFMNLGIAGTRFGVVMAHLSIHVPFVCWIMLGYFENIPYEIEEAAIIDGCKPLRVFFYIALPLVQPGLAAAAILTFIIAWNEYLFSLFISGYNAQPLTVAIYRFMGGEASAPQYGIIAAFATLIVIPVVIFGLFTTKYIVGGMTRGAVKG